WAWILAILAIILALQLFFSRRMNSPEEVPLSQVVAYIENERVERIEVRGDSLEVTLKDGTELSSTKETGVGFIETLTALDIAPEKRNSFIFEPNDQSAWNTLFSIAISLAPVLLLIWIFTRGFRQ